MDKKDQILDILNAPNYTPLKIAELAFLMGVAKDQKAAFQTTIQTLLSNGDMALTKTNKLATPSQLGFVKGIFYAAKKGYSFVKIEGKTEDIFVPETAAMGAMDRDVVFVRLLPKKEAQVTGIVKRHLTSIVGTVHLKPKPHIRSDQSKIPPVFIDKTTDLTLTDGLKAVIKITKYPSAKSKLFTGDVVEVLGHVNEPGMDILSIIKEFDIPTHFSEDAQSAADHAARTPFPTHRKDLRSHTIVTIDGEDAKDLDDGISLEIKGDSYVLGVHIADVAHYVQPHTQLDNEAFDRGTSVYLADRVIPMLPPVLSNGVCSLTAGEDRLALSCFMEINSSGQVVNHTIEETLIHVEKRMSYTQVANALKGESADDYTDYVPLLTQMATLASILRDKRQARGALDFGMAEAKILLDPMGKPTDIVLQERNVATNLIEEFMLIANETIAEHFYWLELPFVYRNHEKPDSQKLESLNQFIANFGYRLKGNKAHPKSLQGLLTKLENTKEENIISRIVLRSLNQARYSNQNDGHFGLSAKYYCHFTSPIRRYPDLAIHRIIKAALQGQVPTTDLYDTALHCSRTERRAVDAERKTLSYKKAEFMSDKIGKTFTGVISSITSWGIYVELPNTVEGMIKKSDLKGDDYTYDKDNHRYVGARKGHVFSLGDPVKVKLDKIFEHKLDFVLAK